MTGVLLVGMWMVVTLLAAAVTARRERLASADNPFRRAPRAVVWRDRIPALLLAVWLVASQAGMLDDVPIAWQAVTGSGGVLILLAACLLNEWTRRPAAGARAALLRPRSVRDLMPRLLSALSGISVLIAVGVLAWLAVVGGTPGHSPCDALRVGQGSQQLGFEEPKTLSTMASLGAIGLIVVCMIVAAGLAVVAVSRPATGADAEVDGELRRRAVVRAVAAVGAAGAALIMVAGSAVQARYPAAFDSCSSATFDPAGRPTGRMETVGEPSVLAELGWSAVMMFAISLLAFAFYRFAAPSQGWRATSPRGVEARG